MWDKNIKVDGVVWMRDGLLDIQPLCPIHFLRLYPYPAGYNDYSANMLSCEECAERFQLPRKIYEEKRYIKDKVASKAFRDIKILNLDDEAIPLVEKKIKSQDNKFFITAVLTESKVGLRVVIYAGETGKKEKTQIFVEPKIKRLAFDQNDLHPSEVFSTISCEFKDGTKTSIESPVVKRKQK
ncbi:MAG: hypothetical protein AAB458_01375 [Patescibacteria group bacterium]|mgnify:CR=1 FL=1